MCARAVILTHAYLVSLDLIHGDTCGCRLVSKFDGDVQVVQRPDEAAVAFAYEDAADLPQATLSPRSSLCAPAAAFAVLYKDPVYAVAMHLLEPLIKHKDL